MNYTVNALAQVAGPINNTGINNISVSPSVGNNTYSITNITDANGCVNQNNPINAQNIYVNPLPDISITCLTLFVMEMVQSSFYTCKWAPPYILDYTETGNTTLFTANVPAAGLPVIVNPDTTTTYEINLCYRFKKL